MMKRDECLRALARHCPDDIVVAVYSSAFDWVRIRPHDLNYFAVGAMGLASSHGLGLALGQPGRKVVVLDGDGSLLMNLGSLVTVADVAPRNFYHFVSENGTYEANGAHPIPARDKVDFGGFARAAGYSSVHQFSELATFERDIAGVLAQPGPVFVDLKLVPGEPAPADYDALYAASRRDAFRKALGQAR
jgi:sulfopyruvate decarboxylase subunit beta